VIETPVLIVGGGPVGLALAVELGWRGVDCVLLEQTDGAIATPKMNEVNIRTMEFCRRWGIADKVMRCPFPDDYPMDVAIVTRVGGHELGRIERPARKDQRPGPFSPMNLQVCSQTWFDPILHELADSFSGVKLLYRHRLETSVVTGGGVEAEVTNLATGERFAIRAAHLAGCDGAGSAVRRALGVRLIGSDALSHSMNLFFRTPDLPRRLGVKPATFFAMLDRDGLWGNVRVIDPKQGLWRILFDLAERTDPKDVDREACLRRAVAKSIDVEWVGVSQWTRRGVVAERYGEGPIQLAGDAVHQLSPTGALGMNTGIADAVDLGWKLAALHDGWGGANLLASYDAERRPAGQRNVRMATAFFEGQAQFQEGLDGIDDDTQAGAALRERIAPQAARHIARVFGTVGLQIGFRYEDSPICVADGTPPPPDEPQAYHPTSRPGSRAPHAELSGGRSTLDLFGSGFVLLRLGSGPPDPSPLRGAAAARRVPLEVVTIGDPELQDLYERPLVLVRPDGHVAWRGDALPPDPDRLVDRVRGALS
jgi:2-polyprenyl-6-methoxyphenol hydroxylase-like FAD-dependent oxidoreductase